jgi:AcrR family transcriptional regulator
VTLNPRKRPIQRRALVTVDAILEAAAQIIGVRGLEGFTTNAVAERAGVSIGSLYQYFASKDALMAALIERQQAAQIASVASAIAELPEEATLEAVVRALVRAAMQHHNDDPLLASAIDHEELRLPLDDRIGVYLDQGGALVAGLLERFAGETASIDPDAVARTLPSLVRGVVDAWANLSPPQLDRAVDEAVRAVLGYLRYREPGNCVS